MKREINVFRADKQTIGEYDYIWRSTTPIDPVMIKEGQRLDYEATHEIHINKIFRLFRPSQEMYEFVICDKTVEDFINKTIESERDIRARYNWKLEYKLKIAIQTILKLKLFKLLFRKHYNKLKAVLREDSQ